mmetsp:Transcript_29506/g.43367  ORF Transcript_29506/g.43367 Transcript_29506/m.43367 type:complete len:101 (+) Transcript_29506:791-1093(+)
MFAVVVEVKKMEVLIQQQEKLQNPRMALQKGCRTCESRQTAMATHELLIFKHVNIFNGRNKLPSTLTKAKQPSSNQRRGVKRRRDALLLVALSFELMYHS